MELVHNIMRFIGFFISRSYIGPNKLVNLLQFLTFKYILLSNYTHEYKH